MKPLGGDAYGCFENWKSQQPKKGKQVTKKKRKKNKNTGPVLTATRHSHPHTCEQTPFICFCSCSIVDGDCFSSLNKKRGVSMGK